MSKWFDKRAALIYTITIIVLVATSLYNPYIKGTTLANALEWQKFINIHPAFIVVATACLCKWGKLEPLLIPVTVVPLAFISYIVIPITWMSVDVYLFVAFLFYAIPSFVMVILYMFLVKILEVSDEIAEREFRKLEEQDSGEISNR